MPVNLKFKRFCLVLKARFNEARLFSLVAPKCKGVNERARLKSLGNKCSLDVYVRTSKLDSPYDCSIFECIISCYISDADA